MMIGDPNRRDIAWIKEVRESTGKVVRLTVVGGEVEA